MQIIWLGNASFKIVSNEQKVIYIDPYADEFGYEEKADLVLVSNSKYDHSARDKIRKITGDYTRILTSKENSGNINGEAMNILDEKDCDGVQVMAIEANSFFYTDAIGFLIKVDGRIIYFAGSTLTIPDLDVAIDILLIPIGGTYVMDPKKAAHAVEILKPKIVIPMHYGSTVGTLDDAEHFVELLEHYSESRISIMQEGKMITLF